MEFIWLEDFVALAETGNFSRAAEVRHVTQPAFSRRVRALEEWVGAPLFERGPHGVTLTATGEQFRSGADELIRRVNQLRRESREAGGKEAAALRFAATHALSFTFFPQWMRDMESHVSLGPVRLISDSMQACEELMLHGQAHFLLCHHHAAAPVRFEGEAEFQFARVGRDALIPLVAPDADGQPKWRLDRPDDRPNDRPSVEAIPYLAYSEESGLGRIVRAQHYELRIRDLQTVFSAQLAATLMTMARHGRGVAWLPATLAAQDVEHRSLVRAADSTWDIEVDICVFRPSGRQSRSAELFWQKLTAR